MRRALMIAAALALSGCGAIPQKPPHLGGSWGGPHIGLVLEGGLGTLSYDCASGTLDKPIVPGPEGRFTSSGIHRPGQGGPIRVGQIFTTQRAEYSGTVTGETMELSVALDDGSRLGPFHLTRGAEPQLTRCL